jgi:hypothetical protein
MSTTRWEKIYLALVRTTWPPSEFENYVWFESDVWGTIYYCLLLYSLSQILSLCLNVAPWRLLAMDLKLHASYPCPRWRAAASFTYHPLLPRAKIPSYVSWGPDFAWTWRWREKFLLLHENQPTTDLLFSLFFRAIYLIYLLLLHVQCTSRRFHLFEI